MLVLTRVRENLDRRHPAERIDDIAHDDLGASAPEIMVRDVINALRRVTPVEVFTLPGQDEHIEFRVPVELLDVPGAKTISKDSKLGHTSSTEAFCR